MASGGKPGKPTTTVTTYDAKGNPVRSVTTDPNTVAPTTDAQKRNQAYFESMAHFSNALLTQYGDQGLTKLMHDAVTHEYTDQQFWDAYNKTQFAIDRSKAQELYDIESVGLNADTWAKKVSDTEAQLQQKATEIGLNLHPEDIHSQAVSIVRSDLAPALQTQWIAQQWQDNGQPVVGQAHLIQSQLKQLAHDYGLSLTQDHLTSLTGQALGQGDKWQEWVAGQEGVFKQDAANLYPGAGQMLGTRSLSQIATPYLQDAANVLGLSSDQMDLTDPKWTGFINGSNGLLSRDEWQRVLRTDPKYGFDSSVTARQQYAALGDQLLGAFGKA